MTRRAPQTFGIRELQEALRTAFDYVDAVRGALEAMESGLKTTQLGAFPKGPGPIFVRKDCLLDASGVGIVRKDCQLAVQSTPGTGRLRRKPAYRR